MKQVEIARQYLGKREKSGNSGFEDASMEADMKKFGEWQITFAWCCCFAQMVFRKAFPEKSDALKKLFDPSTRTTFDNFKKAGYTISQKPVVGSLVIWATYNKGKREWTGHAGICSTAIDDVNFKAIEGNGSVSKSRNGDRVVENARDTKIKSTGLNVMGFIIIE